MQRIGSPRRVYLLARRFALLADELGLAGVWRAKQEAEPGAALPSGFPFTTKLDEAGYTTAADLDGADEHELVDAGLSPREASTVLAAAAEL